jgi:ribosomal protein S18/ribosomal protein S6
MFILHNRDLPEGETASPEDVVVALVQKCGGEVAHKLLWANRKLAYPIAGNQTGTYVLCYFTGNADTCSLLNREVALSDRCVRHLAIALDRLPTAEEVPGPLAEPVARMSRRVGEGEGEDGAAPGAGGPGGRPERGERGDRAERGERGADAEPAIAVAEPGEKEKKVHESLDYKNVYVLRRLVTSQGKLFSRVRSNLHAKHQRQLRQAVLRARLLALLPFVAR